MKHNILLITLIALTVFSSCKKENTPESASKKIAPDGFDFATFKQVDVNIRLLSNVNEPLRGVILNIYTDDSKAPIARGISDNNGYLRTTVSVPSYVQTLSIDPSYIGVARNVKANITNNAVTCVLGGEKGLSGILTEFASVKSFGKHLNSVFGTTYTPLGTYDGGGRPNYLEAEKGTVSANLLSYINATLPENINVKNVYPQYVSNNSTEHLNVVELSDIWITFVHEGAGNLNTVGYYTYPTNNPPATVDEITNVTVIFPNASFGGSGGGMQAGDRVKLGRFNPGTSIGFVLINEGWNNALKTIDPSKQKYYSDSKFNPEPAGDLQTHTVLLKYHPENLFLIGFEDNNRSNPMTDSDFNDILMYATSNPVTAISSEGVNSLSSPTDTDGDGVLNTVDEFDDDPTKAYTTYFPSANTNGTLAFEDNWPQKGDYDMNDLVLNYRYKYINNAENKVVEMEANLRAEVAFADFKNGFGIQLPVAESNIASVTGQKLTEGYVSLNSNGTESGQDASKAVIIAFDNHNSLIQNEVTVIDSVLLKISFKTPVSSTLLSNAPYNPFLICNRQRGIEIHLPGNLPTQKPDQSVLTGQHDLSSSTTLSYLANDNSPWGLSFFETFNYPKPRVPITEAYLHFAEWAASGGGLYPDWYKNTAAGYRNPAKIY